MASDGRIRNHRAGIWPPKFSAEDLDLTARAGENKGCMTLKGAHRSHVGPPEPDRWGLTADLEAVARRWGIHPDRDLACTHQEPAP